jgi:hypothetical protein
MKKSKPVKKIKKKKIVKSKVKPKIKPKKKIAPKSVKKASLSRVLPKPKSAPLPLAPKTPPGLPGEKFLGKVEDFFGKISVIALTLKEALSVEDTIHVHGHTTDFIEEVKSIQADHKSILFAKKKDSVGIKISQKARKGDNVYLM